MINGNERQKEAENKSERGETKPLSDPVVEWIIQQSIIQIKLKGSFSLNSRDYGLDYQEKLIRLVGFANG